MDAALASLDADEADAALSTVSALQEENAQLRHNGDTALLVISTLQKSLAASASSNARLASEAAALRDHSGALAQRLAAAERAASSARLAADEARRSCESEEGARRSACAELESLRTELARSRAHGDELSREAKVARESASREATAGSRVALELSSTRAQLAEARAKLGAAEDASHSARWDAQSLLHAMERVKIAPHGRGRSETSLPDSELGALAARLHGASLIGYRPAHRERG